MTDTPKAHRLAGSGSVVSLPTYDYLFDREADEAAFKDRGKREQAARKARQAAKDRDKLKKMQRALAEKRAAKFEEQRIEARALFADGHNYASIALQLGVGKMRAHELVDEDYHQIVKARRAVSERNRRKAA